MSENVLSVSDFVHALKILVVNNSTFKNVAITGEISNFNAHHSGHFYFSLKDKNSRISCVMFKSKSSRVLFKPKNGDKVIIMGYCDVFESNGTVQIYAERMNLDGLGDLHIQYEALKLEYLEKGYFNPELKKQIIPFPTKIAVITGKDSAAHADISRTLKQRWPMAQQIDLFAYVQGEYAVNSIVEQIEQAQNLDVDAILLARGGGSIEDLWAFNEPRVIEAVFNSKVVVVSGVGHESDTTLVDFVSDFRAATPTGAAVALTPDKVDVFQSLRDYKNRFYLQFTNQLKHADAQYHRVINESYLKNPKLFFDKKQQLLDYHQSRIVALMKQMDRAKEKLVRLSHRNEMLIRTRLTYEENSVSRTREHMISHSQRKQDAYLNKLNALNLRNSASLRNIKYIVEQFKLENSHYNRRIFVRSKELITLNQRAFNDIIKSLDLLSPLKIMQRGFALVYEDNHLIKSINDVSVNSELNIRLEDGTLSARVEKREFDHE